MHLDTIQRPATIKNENYSKALFTFAQKYHFGFHPMISSYRIEEQINNYHTWIKLLYKYWPDNFSSTIGQVMQLETREQGWTDEKIQIYLQWLKYLIDTDCKQYYNGDYNKFFNNIVLRKDTSSKFLKTSYLPYSILPKPQTHLNCAFGKTLFIRLGDLSIVPCHRTSYNKFILGQFKTQNDKIIGVECNNFPLTSSIYLSGYAIKPFCNNCAISNYCNKYCIGANYETNHELFHPE